MTTPHTITQSVQDPLVYIGPAFTNLYVALAGHVRDPEVQSRAEKAAHADGVRLEVSWAVTADARLARNALRQAYRDERDGLPGYRAKSGEWVEGVVTVEHKTDETTLHWEHYVPLDDSTLPDVPREPGVYRIRIAKR